MLQQYLNCIKPVTDPKVQSVLYSTLKTVQTSVTIEEKIKTN